MPPLPGPRVVLCWTRYPVKTCTTPSAIRTGKCTVSSRCVVLKIRRMFGSRCSLSAAMLNCSSATSHGSRWVWSITAALVFTSTSDASWGRRFQLFDHEPIIRRLAGRVGAVPILEHDPVKALCLKCVAPSAESACHVRREPDVGTRRHDAFEVTPALEEGDRQEPLAVHFQEIERRVDLATYELPRVRVPVVVHLEIDLVLPIAHQDAVQDGGVALSLGDDRVVELARPRHDAVVSQKVWLRVTDAHERP